VFRENATINYRSALADNKEISESGLNMSLLFFSAAVSAVGSSGQGQA
jgi:hypothetical protein